MGNQGRLFYDFGPFRLDTTERLLLRNGQVVPITAKALDMLVILVKNSGHLLEKAELMKQLWSDSFVEEANLSHNVFALRKALGEGDEETKYIETIPRRGYRFVGQVRQVVDDGAELIVQEHAKSHVVIKHEEDESRGDAETPGRIVIQDLAASPRRRVSVSFFTVLMAIALLAVTGVLVFFWMANKTKLSASDASVKSIAVLPFKPLVADSRDESLELGMADTLINKLSAIKQLIVRPLSDVRGYTRLEQNAVAAGHELGVDYVLEGNLQMVGDKTRATVRLVSVKDGSAVWTDKCDHQCSNIFELQDAIAERVAKALSIELTGEDKKQLAKHYTENTEAYHLYNMGMYCARNGTKEGTEKSIEYFEHAIKLDPNYVQVYYGFFVVYFDSSIRSGWLPKEARQKIEWAALKIVDLDDTLPSGHAALAYVREINWDWVGAEKEYKRALELDPNSFEANGGYTYYLVDVGRPDEALVYARRAEELGRNFRAASVVPYVYCHKRRYDTAIELYLNAIEKNPKTASLHCFLAEAYVANGMYEEAVAEMQRALALDNSPERWSGYPMLAYAYAVAGKRREALKILGEQKQLAKQRYISPFNFAMIYTGLGDKNRALQYLNEAYEEGSQLLVHLKSRPMWDNLRSDPRYKALLGKMNFSQ